MNETYNINAIVLFRQPFKEFDDRVTVYSPEIGLKELVVRGTKKVLSKLSGHIEPLSLSSLMVVRGKQYDYAGTVVSSDCFQNLKKDFRKVMAAGRAAKMFRDFMKQDYPDAELYDLLKEYLAALDVAPGIEGSIAGSAFVFRFFQEMGQLPSLRCCAVCNEDVSAAGNRFAGRIGGIVCARCAREKGISGGAVVSGEGLNCLTEAISMNFGELCGRSYEKTIVNEIDIFSSYFLEIMKER